LEEKIVDVILKIAEGFETTAQALRDLAAKEAPQQKTVETIDKIEVVFPKDLRALLNFDVEGDYVKITPRQFLGAENFAKIVGIVRDMGGEYVSAGKNSYFKVPVKK